MASKRDLRDDPEVVKKMALLLSQGASMLEQTCPVCGLPLFKTKKGEIICAVHGRVYLVASEEEAKEVEIDEALKGVEYYVSTKLREKMLKDETDEVEDLLRIIDLIERIRTLRENRSKIDKQGRNNT
ncbi:MAG: hypothetical protein F7B11_00720 [Caldisphaeraceae archaeon]|nr:hypothetical protein [Caldisphaeraceae archaeon]